MGRRSKKGKAAVTLKVESPSEQPAPVAALQKAPLLRSSSLGAIGSMEESRASASNTRGTSGLEAANTSGRETHTNTAGACDGLDTIQRGDRSGWSRMITNETDDNDDNDERDGGDGGDEDETVSEGDTLESRDTRVEGRRGDKVTPPTVPALDVAAAAATQHTAPPIAQHTARDRDQDEWEAGSALASGGFLSGRQRSPVVYDSARSTGRRSSRMLEAERGLGGHRMERNHTVRIPELAETPRSPGTRGETVPNLDSVGSPGNSGVTGSTGNLAGQASREPSSSVSLGGFLAGELIPQPVYHTADMFWGQTERDRVYNALWYVPYQLERLIGFGNAICMHAFLGIFTMLPLRVGRSLLVVTRAFLSNVGLGRRPQSPVRVPKKTLLRGDQIYDLICASIFVVMTLFLWHLRAGAIYFWVKELTQEFLKLSVLHTALELGDKICCSFGVDVLEALAASCTTLSTNPTPRNAGHVAADALVALMLLLAHAGALMCQALVYGVAMNSKKNSLLALLIASNFTEIKGTVFKRFDPTKIFTLTCQDIIERFHLYVILSFVLVEESVGSGQPLPSQRLVVQCMYVLFAEIVIDVTKHAVLGKFNDIRPGVYAEFTKDLCENLEGTQSHTVHKLVGIEPFASAALFFRVFVSFVALQRDVFLEGQSALVGIICTATWFALVAATVLFGYTMRRLAAAYLSKYSAKTTATHSRRVIRAVTTVNKKAA